MDCSDCGDCSESVFCGVQQLMNAIVSYLCSSLSRPQVGFFVVAERYTSTGGIGLLAAPGHSSR